MGSGASVCDTETKTPGDTKVLVGAHRQSCVSTGDTKSTPLHVCAANGDLKGVNKILTCGRGVHVDAKDSLGRTPLCIAISKGHVAIAESLRNHRAETYVFDHTGKSPFDLALESGHRGAIEFMVSTSIPEVFTQKGCDLNPLAAVVMLQMKDLIPKIIERGSPRDYSSKEDGRTAMHIACAAPHSYVELVQCLVDSGCSVNVTDSSGETPLHIAAKLNRTDLVEFLISKNAVIESLDIHDTSPIHYITACGDLPLINRLADILKKEKLNLFTQKGYSWVSQADTRHSCLVSPTTTISNRWDNTPAAVLHFRLTNSFIQVDPMQPLSPPPHPSETAVTETTTCSMTSACTTLPNRAQRHTLPERSCSIQPSPEMVSPILPQTTGDMSTPPSSNLIVRCFSKIFNSNSSASNSCLRTSQFTTCSTNSEGANSGNCTPKLQRRRSNTALTPVSDACNIMPSPPPLRTKTPLGYSALSEVTPSEGGYTCTTTAFSPRHRRAQSVDGHKRKQSLTTETCLLQIQIMFRQASLSQVKTFRIQCASDLHLETSESNSPFILQPSAPYLALLGDSVSVCIPEYRDRFILFLQETVPKFEKIYILLGNHEYYRGTVDETHQHMAEVCDLFGGKVQLLQNSFDDIGDVRVIGTTLWSNIPASAEEDVNANISDYHLISVADPVECRKRNLTVEDTNLWHKQAVEFLTLAIHKAKKSKKTVIILTHYSPVRNYGDSPGTFYNTHSSYAFSTDLKYFFSPPVVAWLYGHTHWYHNQIIRGTHVASNPHGYHFATPGPHTQFRNDFVIEVPILRY
ncbi:Serine/threonine protein phosphatase [Pelomyxa schiedti]|nr:Serine/threonine protein phosphatase [Pelomyxa schiedti]